MPDLFRFGRLERLKGVVDAGLVPIPNGSEARWARDASGRQWVRKRESDTGFQPLLAEAVAYRLGQLLEVRQPDAAVFHDGAEWSWMSERLGTAGEHWHPDMRDLISNLDEVGRMIALDAITCNPDRHRQNILVEPLEDEAHLRLWAIDSGKALVGWPGDFIAQDLQAPSAQNHARGLPVEVLEPHAMAAAQVAAQLPEGTLAAIVAEACELAREPLVDALANALIRRCLQAPQIVRQYVDALGALS